MSKVNLIDLNFKSLSQDEKRYCLMLLDICMKRYHEAGYFITSFEPYDIYCEDNLLFYFDKFEKMSPINSNNKEDAVFKNIIGLSNLAFCIYLTTYDIKNGLLNTNVVAESFPRFKANFNDLDYEYYKSVFDNINTKKLPSIPYYYDFIKAKEKNNTSKGTTNSRAYVKATEAGKMYSEMYNTGEAAFGKMFFFMTVIASVLVLIVGFIVYFI